MIRVPYGKARAIRFPLITAGAQAFGDDSAINAIASGDVKLLKAGQPWDTALQAEQVDFTSGSEEPKPGHVLSGATSTETVTVIEVVVRSGTWGGGDAAGSLIVQGASGALQSENLDNDTTGSSNVMTIGGDVAELIFEYDGSYGWVTALTDVDLQCREAVVRVKDQTATELWEDVDVAHLITTDHPLAGDPDGCRFAGTAQSVTASTLVAEASNDGVANPLSADASIAACLVLYIESASTGAGQAVPVASFTHGTLTFNLLHNWPLTPTGTIVYKVYSIARMPAHVMAAASGVQVSLEDDAITAGKFDQSTAFPMVDANGTALTEAGGTGDQLSAIPWNAAWDAEVQSEATDALNAYDPPTKAELDVLGTAALATSAQATSILAVRGVPPTNTALSNLIVAMRDGDGDLVSGLTLTVTRSIDGGAFASATGTAAEIGSTGIYQFDASQADMNGGIIVFRFVGTGAKDSTLTIVTDAAF